jgi:glycosyltransferase involved in cell wall biosynthesis
MRVVNVNMSLDPVHGGGTVERTFQLSRHIAKNDDIECSIITIETGVTRAQKEELFDVELVLLKSLSQRFHLPYPSIRKLSETVKNADIIHLMNHWTIINVVVYYMARIYRKPHVVCPAGALAVFGRSQSIKSIFNILIGKKIVRNAAAAIAVSENEISEFLRLGVIRSKIHLIPNGVSATDYVVSDQSATHHKVLSFNKPYILFMGRLNQIKGPDLLLEAYSTLNDDLANTYHLIFAGPDGGMLTDLKQKVEYLGMNERVHFIGYVQGQTKAMAYYGADLLVIPSRKEAMSIVVLEAGITGTPVLITDQCGFNDIAAIDGGLVVAADAESLKSGLQDLLIDSKRLKSMGKNLYSYTSSKYLWEKVSKLHIELYDKILEDIIDND